MSMLLALLAAAASPAATPPKEDSPEEIAKDAARDLKEGSFYNKPGATRAQYDADWQECRLIARGSRTPGGTIPVYYNPAVISPAAAAIGGGIGGLIGAAIAEGVQRRANRRSCLLIKGWRSVEVDDATKAKVAAMTDAERDAHFASVVGAADVMGLTDEFRNDLAAPMLANGLNPGAKISAAMSVTAGKKVDLAKLTLEPGQGAILVGFRRADEHSLGKSAAVSFARYKPADGDLEYQPRDWKKKGDKTTYAVQARSVDKKAGLELHVIPVTAGRYAMTSAQSGPYNPSQLTTFCLGAPSFEVKEGEVVYFGDLTPYMAVPGAEGKKLLAIPYSQDADGARALLAAKQPTLAAAFKPAAVENDATWGCIGQTMTAYRVPGAPAMAAASGPATTSR
jgi:hypothetical protein